MLTNAELAAIHDAGVGLVFNDYTSGAAAAQYNVLHAAGCSSVVRMLRFSEPGAAPSVPKIFFDTAPQARFWLLGHRCEEQRAWKVCAACRADSSVARESGRADAIGTQAMVSDGADGPFRETEAELVAVRPPA